MLDQIGVAHEVCPADVDESVRPGERPADYVQRLARHKAETVHARAGAGRAVLAADTTVELDGTIYGKPEDREDGIRMLLSLAGRTHRVLTAVALAAGNGLDCALSTSHVRFGALTRGDCERYWATGEPADKAGAYAVQGLGALFIQSIEGSYTGIMGLPLYETGQLLVRAGIGHALGPRSP